MRRVRRGAMVDDAEFPDWSRVDEVLDPGLASGLGQRSLGELRELRARCQAVEAGVSYVRRLCQAEIDLAAAEIDRRSTGAAEDPSALVARLPEILGHTGGIGAQRSPARALRSGSDDELPVEVVEGFEHLIAGLSLPTNLAGLSDAGLRDAIARLDEREKVLSARRRALHERIDTIQAIIVDRYRSGRADATSLLRNDRV
jgi:hypothetical protein